MAVVLPPNSTGTTVDTVTVSSKDREIVVLGDPATAVNVAAVTAKGTQGAYAVSTQDLLDSGRNAVVYYMAIPVITTTAEVLMSLTGTKGGATVTATTTPAAVTTGKTYRIQRFWATYIATATSGYGIARLRYLAAGGTVLTSSPLLTQVTVGAGTPGTANSTGSQDAPTPDGLEIPAGATIGITIQGMAAVTGTAVGYVIAGVSGFEY